MAIAKIHFSVFKDAEIYEVFYNFFSKVEIIEKNDYDQTVTLRVQGEEIPDDTKQIDIEVYKFEGIKPFVTGFNIYDYVK